MNTKLITFNIITLLAIAVALLRGDGAGPLDPPSAPADGVYRTLGEIYDAVKASDPRTPISSVPFVIDQPGSYYLTNNLMFSGASSADKAITISTSDVSLDLNGFAIRSTPGSDGVAISVGTSSVGHERITIRNGSIVGNTTVEVDEFGGVGETIPDGFHHGVFFPVVAQTLAEGSWRSVRLIDLMVSKCRSQGVYASMAIATGCVFSENGREGISSYQGNFMECVAYKNGGSGLDGASAVNCQASSNGSVGIVAEVVAHCVSRNNRVRDYFAGVVVGSYGAGDIVGDVVSQSRSPFGVISGDVVSGCATSDGRIVATVAVDSAVDGLLSKGIQSSVVGHCASIGSDGLGISGGIVTGSLASFSTEAGIHASVISQSMGDDLRTPGNSGAISLSYATGVEPEIDTLSGTRTGNFPTP